MVSAVTDENLASFVDAPLVVLDFWADWCGPCKIMSPVIEDLAKQYDGQIKFGSVDVDKYKDIALKYKVMGMPTLVIFKNGQGVEKVTGVYPKASLAKFMDQKLSEGQA